MTREEAIDLLEDIKFSSSDYPRDIEALEMAIKALEQPEQKKGKWVKKKHLIPLAWDSGPFIWENYDEETHSEWKEYWHCSKCDYEADRDMKPRFKYCPECGSKMEAEQ